MEPTPGLVPVTPPVLEELAPEQRDSVRLRIELHVSAVHVPAGGDRARILEPKPHPSDQLGHSERLDLVVDAPKS